MSNRTYRVTEIVGTSPEGVDHAIRNGIERAAHERRFAEAVRGAGAEVRDQADECADLVAAGDERGDHRRDERRAREREEPEERAEAQRARRHCVPGVGCTNRPCSIQ